MATLLTKNQFPTQLDISILCPAARAQVDCNHWSQQLPAHESPVNSDKAHHVHAPGKQSQNPDNVRTRHNRTRRLTGSHTTFHLDTIPLHLSRQSA